tara:strand:- start:4121 stop:4522 length:402 start_codon:yes stop_codon:yes gene_type:complete
MKNLYDINEKVDNYEINILPMIDVIFAILTFFIISSLYLIKLETIPLNLPSASTSSISKEEFINVSISNDEKIFLNSEEIDLRNLNNKLQSINIQNNKKVIISGDKNVDYGRIVEVLDELRKINNLKMAISTK